MHATLIESTAQMHLYTNVFDPFRLSQSVNGWTQKTKVRLKCTPLNALKFLLEFSDWKTLSTTNDIRLLNIFYPMSREGMDR